MENKREGFGSRLGFLLVTIGFSVGVGTLWRFPYLCGELGGGLFLITYIILMIVIGIPLFSAEVSLGLASRKSPVQAYQKLSGKKAWGIVGWVNMAAIILVIGYTLPVYGWIIHYIYTTLTGTYIGMDSAQIAEHYVAMSVDYPHVFLMIIINIILTMLVVRKNLQAGIEKIAKVLLPSLAIIMVIVTVYGLTLDGATEGLEFFFTWDFSSFSMETILSALGQVFFSLGIAMAVALVFGSYQKEGELNVVKNSAIISCAVIFVAVLAGMMIFPMVYSFGLSVTEGPGLVFVVMPNVFNQMAGGVIWGTLFYIAFFIAAFSSGIAGWEAVMGFLMDQFNLTRQKALWGTLVLVCIVGIPATVSTSAFNLFDMITNNVFLTIGAFCMSIFVGWIWGIPNFLKTIGMDEESTGAKCLGFVIKYLSPVVIIVFSLTLFGVI